MASLPVAVAVTQQQQQQQQQQRRRSRDDDGDNGDDGDDDGDDDDDDDDSDSDESGEDSGSEAENDFRVRARHAKKATGHGKGKASGGGQPSKKTHHGRKHGAGGNGGGYDDKRFQHDLPFLDSMRSEFNPGAHDKRPSVLNADDFDEGAYVPSKYCLVYADGDSLRHNAFDIWDTKTTDKLLGDEGQEYWLDVLEASDEDLEHMQQKQGIHSVTLGDILGGDNRERVEFFDSYLLVCLQLNSADDTVNEGPFVTMLLFPNAIFTFHDEPCPSLRALMEKLATGTSLLTPDRVMYLLLGEALKVWIPVVHSAEDEVESLHDLALVLSDSDKNDTLLRMAKTRRLITNIHRKLLAKRDVLRAVTVGAFPFVRPETQPYLRDALDHLMDLLRIVNISRDALNQLQANYLAKVSLDLADSAQKTNVAMKVFSLVATIGLPINAISGILGMNVWYPGRVEEDQTGVPFAFTISLMLAIGFVMFVFFRWYRLL